MSSQHQHYSYIDGQWTAPAQPARTPFPVVDPATGNTLFQLPLCGPQDVDRAVAAAKRAFGGFSQWTKQQRLDLLRKVGPPSSCCLRSPRRPPPQVRECYARREEAVAQAIRAEMGALPSLAQHEQAPSATYNLDGMLETLEASGSGRGYVAAALSMTGRCRSLSLRSAFRPPQW